MDLQVALDLVDDIEAAIIVEKIYDYIDIIEIGTPLIKYNGANIVRKFKKRYPDKILLVDLKTIDDPHREVPPFFEVGADRVTVLGLAENESISIVVDIAKSFNKEVVGDLINVQDILKRAQDFEKLGVDFVQVHASSDRQSRGENPISDLELLKGKVKTKLMAAGGISINTIEEVVSLTPDVVVVGGALTKAENPLEIAKALKTSMLEGLRKSA